VTEAPGDSKGGCVEDEGVCVTVVADEAPGCEDEAAAGDTDGEAVGVFEAVDDCVAFAIAAASCKAADDVVVSFPGKEAAPASPIEQGFVWTAVACVSVEAVRPE